MSKAPIAQLTRRTVFSSSHRLHSDQLSEIENQKVFGKCNSLNGHGHNYILYVTIKGPVDPQLGVVANLDDIKQLIQEQVMAKVDHRHLNLDVPEFVRINPTVENVAVVIWNWLKPHLPLLYEIKLFETENNFAVYRGES